MPRREEHPRDDHGGRQGVAPGPADDPPREARRPVRRPLPDHRLRPVELHQLGLPPIYVLTQYMSSSLIKHLNRNWRLSGFGEFIEVVPAQMRIGEFWYRGTADAVYQNLNLVRDARADHVAVFGGDHVYKIAVDQMEDAAPRAARPTSRSRRSRCPSTRRARSASSTSTTRGRIVGFVEKPKNPPRDARPPRLVASSSMGNYIFRRDVLERVLVEDGNSRASRHDFGRDIIPRLVHEGARVYVYDFAQNQHPRRARGRASRTGATSARSIATSTSNMELRARVPALDLYNRQWRIRSAQRDYPPARFVRAGEGGRPRGRSTAWCARARSSRRRRSRRGRAGYDCFVHAGAQIAESVHAVRLRHRPRTRGCAACCSTRTARSSRAA